MKILLIHPHEVFSEIEPWTSRILNIALKLSSLGHDVKLVHFPLKEYRLPNPHNYKQIEIIALSRKIGLGIFFDNIKKLCTLSRWADIVHFQKCYYYASVPALLAAFITNKPIHYDWDDWELKIFFYPKKQSRLTGVFLGTTEFLIPYLVDTISVASKKLKEVCLKRGIFEDRIFKASVGADLDKFNPYISREVVRSKFNIDGPLVVYVGQLHGAQYCELFIKAAGSVLKSNPNTTFMVVGDGYRLPSLRKIAQDVGLDGRLIFSGAVSHDQVPFYIS